MTGHKKTDLNAGVEKIDFFSSSDREFNQLSNGISVGAIAYLLTELRTVLYAHVACSHCQKIDIE